MNTTNTDNKQMFNIWKRHRIKRDKNLKNNIKKNLQVFLLFLCKSKQRFKIFLNKFGKTKFNQYKLEAIS